MSSSAQVLPPGAGWGVVIGIGVFFSLFMVAITYAQERYTGVSAKNNDEFTSASRSVKTGLIASGILSAWTWAATLLQSSAVAFKLGVSGSYWYAAGATVQVLLFALVAAKLKSNAPNCTTYLEVVKKRWGNTAHLIFMFFAIVTNVLVGSMLILGGSATVTQLSGMPTLAAIWLTPLSVAIYTLVGGMRATLLADWSHSFVLLIMLLIFAFAVYTPHLSDGVGSPSRMVELLSKAAHVEGNAQGSYLTFRSLDGLKFGIINLCGNFATVFADQSYHQRGIASNPATATKAFIIGGLAWSAVPLIIASSLGLAARAMYGNYPAMAMLTAAEVSSGLPAPAAAAALLGKTGAAMMLVLLYLAVTSATSAQLIAVASIISADVLPYFKPNPSTSQISWAAHGGVVFWAVCLGALGSIFRAIGISMGSLYIWMGIWVSSAVFPIFACICWGKANKMGALVGMLGGLAGGVITWLVAASKLSGELTVSTLSLDDPVLAGNVVSIVLPIIICGTWSYMKPENYTFEGTRAINVKSVAGTPGTATPEKASSFTEGDGVIADEKAQVEDLAYQHVRAAGIDPEQLNKSFRNAVRIALPLSFILIIFVPCMAIIKPVWNTAGLTAWISIIIGWMFISFVVVGLMPIWESRAALGQIFSGIKKDLTGGNGKVARIN